MSQKFTKLIRIDEDVADMMEKAKPHPSCSYNDVIRMLFRKK